MQKLFEKTAEGLVDETDENGNQLYTAENFFERIRRLEALWDEYGTVSDLFFEAGNKLRNFFTGFLRRRRKK